MGLMVGLAYFPFPLVPSRFRFVVNDWNKTDRGSVVGTNVVCGHRGGDLNTHSSCRFFLFPNFSFFLVGILCMGLAPECSCRNCLPWLNTQTLTAIEKGQESCKVVHEGMLGYYQSLSELISLIKQLGWNIWWSKSAFSVLGCTKIVHLRWKLDIYPLHSTLIPAPDWAAFQLLVGGAPCN